MNYDYEVAIIGGGPAGTSSALNLIKKGFNVCLFEKKLFPRDTICGEFLSEEVIQNLKELNIFSNFLSLKPNEIKIFRFINRNNKEISAEFDFKAYSLKRSTFDDFLLKEAKEIGLKTFQPAEVKEIKNLKSHFKISFCLLNQNESISVKKVIAAYGKQNLFDKQLDRNFIFKKSKLTGIKYHIEEKYFNDFNRDEIQIYAGDQIYCGINGVNDGMVTLCFLEDRKSYIKPARQHLLELFNDNIRFNKLFNTDLQFVINNSTLYGTGNIYFGKKNVIENGVYMVGDAAGMIAPLTGDGIGMAFEASKLLSNILFQERKGNVDITISYKKYIYEWKKLFYKRLLTARLIQNLILKNYVRNIGINIAALFPNSLNYIIKRTRT